MRSEPTNDDGCVDQQRILSLVLSNLDVRTPTPLEVVPSLVLRRASASEGQVVAEALRNQGVGVLLTHWLMLEGSRPVSRQFWLIDSPTGPMGAGSPLYLLDQATRLASVHLHCSTFLIGPEKQCATFSMTGMDPFRDANPFSPTRVIDDRAIESIRCVFDALGRIKSTHPQVQRTIDMYHRLDFIPADDPFYLLGAFTVIESVLTHNPRSGRDDSLCHQITEKMRLLNRRFARPLDYSLVCSASLDPNAAWRELYKLRGCIAHGKEPVFDRKVLRDRQSVIAFLDSATQALLRHALQEPDLVLDLQDL